MSVQVRVKFTCIVGHSTGIVYTFNEWKTVLERRGQWWRNELDEEWWMFDVSFAGKLPSISIE